MVYDFAIGNNVFVSSALEEAMQELDILFNTTPTELLGDSSFGTFFESFLWDLQPRESDLKEYIKRAIQNNTFWVNQFDWDVTVTVNDNTESAKNAVNDVIYDPMSIYIVSIDLYSSAEDASYRQNKLGTKIIQF